MECEIKMKNKTNTVECPYCKEKIEPPDYEEMEWTRHGRKWKCPECKMNILFQKPAKNFVSDENGTVKRKYKPKK